MNSENEILDGETTDSVASSETEIEESGNENNNGGDALAVLETGAENSTDYVEDSAAVSGDSVLTESTEVSSGDSSSIVIMQESTDTSVIEQYLDSIDSRLASMEDTIDAYTVSAGDYYAGERADFIGSDITNYNTTDGLLLLIFVSVVIATIMNRWRY